jgi:hypothetical protein
MEEGAGCPSVTATTMTCPPLSNSLQSVFVFILCILLYVHEGPTKALILIKVYSFSYMLLRVSASSMPSSGSLHVPTELLVPSESSSIKFCKMDEGGF